MRYLLRHVVLLPFLFAIPFGSTVAQHPVGDLGDELSQFGEARIAVTVSSPAQLQQIADVSSLLGFDGDQTAWVNVNAEELNKLVMLGYSYRHDPVPRPESEGLTATVGHLMQHWDAYPTYEGYDSMMIAFGQSHPGLCKVHEILTLNSGRKILIAQITSQNTPPGGKPKFLYSSTMHGNETAGYILMLRLIDYLLNGYGTDPEVTWILDNMEVWIAPLTNPDGTYFGGNHTVNQAIRRNANNVDLNRNYPDPRVGANPDGHAYQPETMAFKALADTVSFVMGANLHSGAEVANYPWDTWIKQHPDDGWWRYVCRMYADTVQANSPPGFFTDLDNGITNGAAWYVITGGRQDYMNYYAYCREMTLEVSGIFIEPVHRLPLMWDYHHRALINYLKEGWYGLRGTVTDSVTGNPLRARVTVNQHDADSSHVWSDAHTGHYYRLLEQGTYTVLYEASGYHSASFQVSVAAGDTTIRDVQLAPIGQRVPDRVLRHLKIWYDETSQCLRFRNLPAEPVSVKVYTVDGRLLQRDNLASECMPVRGGTGVRMIKLMHPNGDQIVRKVFVY